MEDTHTHTHTRKHTRTDARMHARRYSQRRHGHEHTDADLCVCVSVCVCVMAGITGAACSAPLRLCYHHLLTTLLGGQGHVSMATAGQQTENAACREVSVAPRPACPCTRLGANAKLCRRGRHVHARTWERMRTYVGLPLHAYPYRCFVVVACHCVFVPLLSRAGSFRLRG